MQSAAFTERNFTELFQISILSVSNWLYIQGACTTG